MKNRPVLVAAVVSAAGLLAGCKCGGDKQVASDAAAPAASSAPMAAASSTTPIPARPPRPRHPAPKAQELAFTTSDGVRIVGSYWSGGEPASPAVLLVHRAAGSRSEWIPLIERLFPPKVPMNVLAIDLRGHGGSVEGKGLPKGKKLAWIDFKTDDFAAMAKDVEAAMLDQSKRAKGAPAAWVLAGSDIGATAATVAAKQAGGSLRGIALISPGSSLRGVDLYQPFAQVLRLPNFIVTAGGDNVSNEPATALSQMSKGSRFLRLSGSMHGAEYLGAEQPILWDELADWVEERLAQPSAASSASAEASGSAAPPAAPADSAPAP